jgi:hypothetical protein
MQRIIMVYGSDDLTVNYSPYHGIPGGWGLFGGYPMGIGGSKYVVQPDALPERLAESQYPVAFSDVPSWGTVLAPKLPPLQRLKIAGGSLIVDPVEVGSGYGDPLDRDPQAVLRDVETFAVSVRLAADVYGVVFAADGLSVDEAATGALRRRVRDERKANAEPVSPSAVFHPDSSGTPVRRMHDYVEIASLDDGRVVSRCTVCAHVYADGAQNYKAGALRRKVAPNEWSSSPLPDGGAFLAELHEFFCPGCATLVDVEVHCPSIESDDRPVWDIRLTLPDAVLPPRASRDPATV